MFAHWFLGLLVAVLAIDWLFLPKSARRAWFALAFAFAAAGSMVLLTEEWQQLASWLGVGRPVDILIYLATAVLLRELFISRARHARTEAQITRIVRAMAINHAQSDQ